MAMNAAAAYKNSKIQTASPAELTLMLYDGAIKFCNLAAIAIEKRQYDTANMNIIKAERIISELRGTLDHKYPVAKSFENIYNYIYQQLVSANIKKDNEILGEALEQIRDIRDTWKEVMSLAKVSNS